MLSCCMFVLTESESKVILGSSKISSKIFKFILIFLCLSLSLKSLFSVESVNKNSNLLSRVLSIFSFLIKSIKLLLTESLFKIFFIKSVTCLSVNSFGAFPGNLLGKRPVDRYFLIY